MMSLGQNAVFVMGTSVNVGKTVCSLGIMSGLLKRMPKSVGYVKPVGGYGGEDVVKIDENTSVDKDCALVRNHFDLKTPYHQMSPVLTPPGFFKKNLGLSPSTLMDRIRDAYDNVQQANEYVVLEGTGHAGMGAIMNLTNARIASQLGADVVLVASGNQRLAGTIDDLALNIQMCQAHNAVIRGIIINRVSEEHMADVTKYLPQALDSWGLPLLGVIPDSTYLSSCNMEDFEVLFKRPMLCGEEHRYRRFEVQRLVTGSQEEFIKRYQEFEHPHHLLITHSSREDIFDACISIQQEAELKGGEVRQGLITTGNYMPSDKTMDALRDANIPTIYTPLSSYHAMNQISRFVPQTRARDCEKIQHAVSTVEQHVDFDLMMNPVWKSGVGRF